MVLDTGAAVNLARFRWLGNHYLLSNKRGFPRVSTYRACARFKFGDGPLGAVRVAADITVGTAGGGHCAGSGCSAEYFAADITLRRGTFAALVLEADIPTSLREGASEAFGVPSDSSRDVLTRWEHMAEIPLKVNQLGHYVAFCDRSLLRSVP